VALEAIPALSGGSHERTSMLDVRARIQPVRVEAPMTGDEGQLT
jgi:hypothetical protein